MKPIVLSNHNGGAALGNIIGIPLLMRVRNGDEDGWESDSRKLGDRANSRPAHYKIRDGIGERQIVLQEFSLIESCPFPNPPLSFPRDVDHLRGREQLGGSRPNEIVERFRSGPSA